MKVFKVDVADRLLYNQKKNPARRILKKTLDILLKRDLPYVRMSLVLKVYLDVPEGYYQEEPGTPDEQNNSTTTRKTTTTTERDRRTTSRKTGDDNRILLWGGILAVAVLGAGLVLWRRKENR